MTVLTVPAVLALIVAHQCVPPPLTPIMVGIAQHESGLDPTAVHHNPNGTVDVGLAQVNSGNFAWLGLTMQTAMDPCRNLAAGAAVLTALSRYNTGSPTRGIANGYAAAVAARIAALSSNPPAVPALSAASIFARPAPGRELVFDTLSKP